MKAHSDEHISPEEWRQLTKATRRKYRNQPTMVNGVRFDSKKEARRAQELMLMQQAGLITDLELDKRNLRYDLIVNGKKISTYVADFRYLEGGCTVVEDVKSKPTRTPLYRRNKKHLLEQYGIEIREV